MIYRNKENEELDLILKAYQDNYLAKTGKELNINELHQKIENLVSQKEQDLFNSVFGTLSIVDLQYINKIDTNPEPIKKTDEVKVVRRRKSKEMKTVESPIE